MGQSHSQVIVHFVFSTKERTPWIEDTWRRELHKIIISIIRRLGGDVICVNSVNDHIHMLGPLPRTISMSDLMRAVKGKSSEWVHERFPHLQAFKWQGGYGAFSVSASHKVKTINYIKNQAEHHRTVTFQDEFRTLLDRYEVTYNEAYLWD